MIASDQSSPPASVRGSSFWPFLTIGCVALLVVLLVALVLRYGIAIPMFDDWDLMPLLTKARQGTVRFSDLFAQQQESRTFFPKLIFILLGLGRRWDGRVGMLLSVFICCLTALGIFELLRKSVFSAMATALGFIMMALLIFSPAPYELWLLASGFSSFVPALCIVWALVALRTNLSVAIKFWVCAGLAILSSFTVANGLLAWALTFPLLFWLQPMPRWKRWLAGWLMACIVCATIYFWRFQPPSELPDFAPPQSPLVYLQYLLAFLGSGLGRSGNEHPLVVSIAAGAFLLFGYCGMLAWAIRRWRDREFWTRAFPWFSLGAYAIASGVLVALGRIEFGVPQALAPRYVAISLYLAIALIALVTILAERMPGRPNSRARLARFTAIVFLGASFVTLVILCGAGSVSIVHLRSASARLGHGALLFSQVMDTSDTLRRTNHPLPDLVRQRASALDRLQLLRPPLVRTTMISKIRHAEADKSVADGWFDSFAESAETEMASAKGWAVLADQGRSADCVLLAYEREDHEWIAFAISSSIEMRPDVAQWHHRRDWLWTGWRAVFRSDAVPKGANISAWAVDAKQAKVYRLGASVDKLNR